MNLTNETRFELPGAVLECALVPWDSATLGFPVAQISRVELGEDAQPAELLDAFEAWCVSHKVRLVSSRLDHMQLRESMALEELGFRFVGTAGGVQLALAALCFQLVFPLVLGAWIFRRRDW